MGSSGQHHHSELTDISDSRKHNITVPMFLSQMIQTIIELPFWLFLWSVQILRESIVIRKCYNIFLEFIIYTLQRILQDPIIQESISTTISEGMNHFVQQPDLDQLLLHMVTSISKSQPDIARQQGQDFPIVVSSFVQGIIQQIAVNSRKSSSQKVVHNNNNNSTVDSFKVADIETSSIGSIDAIAHLPSSRTDEEFISINTPTPSTDEDETLNDHLIVNSSRSSSSMINVRTLTPTTTTWQAQHSEEQHEIAESSPPLISSAQANDSSLPIDNTYSALNGTAISLLYLPTDDSLSHVRSEIGRAHV